MKKKLNIFFSHFISLNYISGSVFYANSENFIRFEFNLIVFRKNYKIKINQKL